jgi:hypothetical protein
MIGDDQGSPASSPQPSPGGRTSQSPGRVVLGSQLRPDLRKDLLILGELPGFELRVHEFAVQTDFKTSLVGGNKLQGCELFAERVHDRLRQAHGLRDVISSDAILNSDFLFFFGHHSRPSMVGLGFRVSPAAIDITRLNTSTFLPPMGENVKASPSGAIVLARGRSQELLSVVDRS